MLSLQISEGKSNCKEEILAATKNTNSEYNIPKSVSSRVYVEDHTYYAGVAMTMMLHSPKWFQKRYTVYSGSSTIRHDDMHIYQHEIIVMSIIFLYHVTYSLYYR